MAGRVPGSGSWKAGASRKKLSGLALSSIAILLLAPIASAQFTGWSDKPPPKGWSADAYSPDTVKPAFGDKFTGSADEPYNSLTDPFHPLKNPNAVPGKAWEKQRGYRKEDNSPGFVPQNVDWPWGERYFQQQFAVTLNIKNHCKTEQPVSIITNQLPFLTFPKMVSVPPTKAGVNVVGKVILPGPPFPTGRPGEPPMGWVDLDPGYIPPGMSPPRLHQPNFVSIYGQVVVWHPWSADTGGRECLPVKTTYTVDGHIHWGPPKPEATDSGPSTIAAIDPCRVWWNTGDEPAQRHGDCTGPMRLLAEHFIDKVLIHYRTNAPKEWEWLVGWGGVDDKRIEQLLDMKRRAEVITGAAS